MLGYISCRSGVVLGYISCRSGVVLGVHKLLCCELSVVVVMSLVRLLVASQQLEVLLAVSSAVAQPASLVMSCLKRKRIHALCVLVSWRLVLPASSTVVISITLRWLRLTATTNSYHSIQPSEAAQTLEDMETKDIWSQLSPLFRIDCPPFTGIVIIHEKVKYGKTTIMTYNLSNLARLFTELCVIRYVT